MQCFNYVNNQSSVGRQARKLNEQSFKCPYRVYYACDLRDTTQVKIKRDSEISRALRV